MTESIKFGPEWLRNMSIDPGSGEGVTMRYQWPEFRYGREEMLLLFNKAKQKVPETLPRFKSLFVENIQNPLAMQPDVGDEIAPFDRVRRGRESYHFTTGNGFQRLGSTDGGRVRSSWNGGQLEPPERNITQLENWRKGCHMDEEVPDGTVGSGVDISEARRANSSVPGHNKLSRPQSWREDDPSAVRDLQSPRPFSGGDHSYSKGQSDISKRLGFWNNYHLPEWALVKSVEGGGSFDGTGAFHESVTAPTMDDKSTTIVAKTKTVATFEDQGSSADDNTAKMALVAVEANTVENVPSANDFCNDRESEEKANLKLLDAKADNEKSGDQKTDSLLNEEMSQNQEKYSLLQQIEHQLEQDRNDYTEFANIQPLRRDNATMASQIPDGMKEITDIMVEKLFLDDEVSNRNTAPIMLNKPGISTGPSHIDLNVPAYGPDKVLQQQQHNFMVPPSAINSTGSGTNPNDEWMYRDPHGNVQGPFSATEMAGWYRAGYFDDSLYVRRVSDSRYAALGDLVRLCGNAVPFELGRYIPPLHQIDGVPLQQQCHTGRQQQWQPVNPHYQSQYQSPQLLPFDYQMQMFQQQNQAFLVPRDHTNIYQNRTSNERQNQHMSQIPQPVHMFHGAGSSSNQTSQQLTMANTAAAAASSSLLPLNLSFQKAAILYLQQQSLPYGNLPSAASANETLQQLISMCQSSSVPPSAFVQFINSTPMHQQAQTSQVEPNKDPIKNLLMQIVRQKGQEMTPQSFPHTENKTVGSMATAAAAAVTETPIFPHHMIVQSPISTWNIPMPPSKMKQEQQQKDMILELKSKQVPMQQQHQYTQPVQYQQRMMQQQLLEQKQLEQHQHQHRILMKYRQECEKKKQNEEEMLKLQQPAINENETLQENDEHLLDDSTVAPFINVPSSKKQTKDNKGKTMELKKQLLEKERQRLLDEENNRLYMEEKKRLNDIAEQRQKKLMEGLQPFRRQKQQCSISTTNSPTAAVAPWSSVLKSSNVSLGDQLSLTDIQKAESASRAEKSRVEQLIHDKQKVQLLNDNALKWNLKPQNVKSLAEIQAEESKIQQALDQEQQNAMTAKKSTLERSFATIWKNNVTPTSSSIWNSNKIWGNTAAPDDNFTNCGFWEKPTKSLSAAAQTVQVKGQTVSEKPKSKLFLKATNAAAAPKSTKKAKETTAETEFSNWCCKSLSAHADAIDVPTFVGFLKEVDSPFEIKDYIRTYLGESKESNEFAKNFLERRNKYKSEQRTVNARTDDLCQPATAITPSTDLPKGKSNKKEKKKNKMTKFDTRILGFSVTAAQDRLNIGDLDYSEDS